MFPSYKQSQQLLELVDAVIDGAVVEITTLTLAAVLRIEAHVLASGATFQVRNFTVRRVGGESKWSFFGLVMVMGVALQRGDTATDLGARLRQIPRRHVERGYSVCDGPLLDNFVCIRGSKLEAPRHQHTLVNGVHQYEPRAPEIDIYTDMRATGALSTMRLWRSLACATTITKKDASSEGQ